MRISDLVETNLRLAPNQLDRARSMYGAFVVVMAPEDFLRLTTDDAEERKSILDRHFPIPDDEYEKRFPSYKSGRFEMPFLIVGFPSGRVVGHEGRHRAAMVMKQGGTKFPCIVYPQYDDIYVAKLIFRDANREEHIREVDFASREAANSHIVQYIIGKIQPPEGLEFTHGKIETIRGGGKLRGAPARSDPGKWQYAAWRVEDFPERLIGQFNPYETVRRFKVGLVKGYEHHREPDA